MKNIKIILLVVVAIFAVAVLSSTVAKAQSGQYDITEEFQKSPAWKKVESRLQQTWISAMKSGNADQRLDCFVRVQYPADQGDQSFLISNGYVVRVFSGSVATGYMKAKNLPYVADLPFVRSIKLSTK